MTRCERKKKGDDNKWYLVWKKKIYIYIYIWDERSEMFFLNDLTDPPEKSLHICEKQVSVGSKRRWQPNFVFHNLTKHDLSVSSSCCAPWRYTGDTQPYMCYYYGLVSPTFDLGFRVAKRNAGEIFRKWRAVNRANAALWGIGIKHENNKIYIRTLTWFLDTAFLAYQPTFLTQSPLFFSFYPGYTIWPIQRSVKLKKWTTLVWKKRKGWHGIH